MANSITLFEQYVPLLDEVYKEVSKTAVLDGNAELIKAGANANELVIPKMQMDGLADYSRNSGYVGGDVTLTNETVPCNFDRGRMFTVDHMDDVESAGVAFGMLAGEFIRTKVAPELDAFRFAAYAGETGVGTASATLSTGADVVSALRAATNSMDESEVPMEDRVLFITPTLLGMVEDLDTSKSREVLSRFSQIVTVPQTRFYTAIEQRDGSSVGETGGGYVKYGNHYEECLSTDAGALKVVADTDTPGAGEIKVGSVTPLADAAYTPAANDYVRVVFGKDINFMAVHRGAVIQFPKHIAPKVVTPEMNPDADAWKFGYRQVGVADVYENKTAGIYVHHKAS